MKKRIVWIAQASLALSLLFTPVHAQEEGKGKDFSGQDLQKRDLRRENLDGANLARANLSSANLTDAIMRKANLREANLTQATLTGADLTGADLRLANFQYISLQRANLSGANLEGLDLKMASLQGCNFQGANLRNAQGIQDIGRADFREADLRGADLRAAYDYPGSRAQFRGARYDARTRWSKTFDLAASGAVLVETATELAPPAPAKPVTPPAVKAPAGTTEANLAPAPAAAAPTLDPNRPAEAPTEAEVKKILEKFWGRDRVENTFTYQSLKYGKPRKGEYRTDGIPANSDTTVFPVQAVCEHLVKFQDGTSRTEVKSQNFVFFQSEFGGWTFRFKGNN